MKFSFYVVLYFLILSVLGFLTWSLDMDSPVLLWSFLVGTLGIAPGCLVLAGRNNRDVSGRKSSLDSLTRYMVGVVFATNLIFIPSVRHLLKFDVWGVFPYEIPYRIVMPFGISISSTNLISIHALLAISLAFLMMIQFLSMMQPVRRSGLLSWHKKVGILSSCLLLPAYVVTAMVATIFVLKTPFNQFAYGLLPLLTIYYFFVGVQSVTRGFPNLHSQSMYIAFILLHSAPIYRCVCAVVYRFYGFYLSDMGLPIHGAAIITYVVLVILIVIPALTIHQLKIAGRSAALLLGLMGLAMLALPWDFFGTPSGAPFIGEGMMQINPRMMRTMINHH